MTWSPTANDLVAEILNEAVTTDWKRRPTRSKELERRIEVLASADPPSVNDPGRQKVLHDCRTAWGRYLWAAQQVGMLDAELVGNLRDWKTLQFRAALAECRACWFLLEPLGISQLTPRPLGKSRPASGAQALLELLAKTEKCSFGVEVKAPLWEETISRGRILNNPALRRKLWSANEKFAKGGANLLVVTPVRPVDVFHVGSITWALESALYGQPIAVFERNPSSGRFDSSRWDFRESGELLDQTHGPPRFRSTSAVMCIEERIDSRLDMGFSEWAHGGVVVMHNPHASQPIPPEIFRDVPQRIIDGDQLVWRYGKPARW